MTPLDALLATSMLHLGVQAVVTVLVYPMFAHVAIEDWPAIHATHTRRIGPLVVVVYGALLLAGAWVVATGPSPAAVVALVASGAAVLVTALVAAPAHGRLAPDRPDAVLRRLLAADRARLVAALVAAVAATVAAGRG